MKFLYVTCAVIERCGDKVYNNALATSLPRYRAFADEIIVACYEKSVERPSQEEFSLNGIQLVKLHKINTLKGLLFDRVKNYRLLKTILPEVDGCIGHVPTREAIMAARLAFKLNIPVLLVVIGCPWDALKNMGIRGKIMAVEGFVQLRKIMAKSTHAIYVTEKFLQNRYPTKGKYIGCSDVSLTAFDEGVLSERLRRIEQTKICKLATLAAVNVKYKGQKKVIRAMAELAKEGIQFEYHLAGTGDQSELKKYAEKYALSDKVIFHGGIPHEQVPGFLDEVDIYIQPSDQEGLPRALVEAMSRACPAIGSRVGGIPELLSEDMIFSPKDINGLCACLKKMTLKRMKEEARRNYERAKDFDKNFLDRRRTAFINEFLKDSGLINN